MASYTAPLDFTNGDTFRRFTITNAAVTAQSDIHVSIRKHEVADKDDVGWTYVPNVVSVINGSFDVSVAALVMNAEPSSNEYPNETVSLVYLTT